MMNPIKVNFKVNFFDKNGKLNETNVMQFLTSNNADKMKIDNLTDNFDQIKIH
jgi:hypothetical protein